VTRYRLDGSGFKIARGKYIVSSSYNSRPALGLCKNNNEVLSQKKVAEAFLYLHLDVWVGVYMYLGIYYNVSAVKRVGIHVSGWLKQFIVNEN
jgi:hypothetical protein